MKSSIKAYPIPLTSHSQTYSYPTDLHIPKPIPIPLTSHSQTLYFTLSCPPLSSYAFFLSVCTLLFQPSLSIFNSSPFTLSFSSLLHPSQPSVQPLQPFQMIPQPLSLVSFLLTLPSSQYELSSLSFPSLS